MYWIYDPRAAGLIVYMLKDKNTGNSVSGKNFRNRKNIAAALNLFNQQSCIEYFSAPSTAVGSGGPGVTQITPYSLGTWVLMGARGTDDHK